MTVIIQPQRAARMAVVNGTGLPHHFAVSPKQPRPDVTQLSNIDKDRLIGALFARLNVAEAKLGTNNDNSSKSPSPDGLAEKTNPLRESSDNKAGGQKGRKGTTLRQAELSDGYCQLTAAPAVGKIL